MVNKLTSGRVMTISEALGDFDKIPSWKETPLVWKHSYKRFQVRSKEQKWGSLCWRTQEMISRVNEAFQECLTTSWYGELNKTYHLKRKLGLKSTASQWSGSPKTQRGRPAVCPTMAKKCYFHGESERLVQRTPSRPCSKRTRTVYKHREDTGHLITPPADCI